MHTYPTPLTRRGLLACACSALVVGCAQKLSQPQGSAASPTGPSASSPTSAAPSGASPTSPPANSPSPSGSATTPDPARDAVIATYSSRTPMQWGTTVTGVVTHSAGPAVALTLDACGGPNPGRGGNGVDTELIDLLINERYPATLFLNQKWIRNNRPVFDRLAANQDLFTLGNHGTRHAPLSVSGKMAYTEHGTASVGEVYDEVMGNQQFMTELLGHAPRFFRTGTAWYDEVAVEVVRTLGLLPIGFDINADFGATASAKVVAANAQKAKPGSILIGHFNRPEGSTFEGLKVALPAMRAKGVRFARIEDVSIA